MQTSRNSWTSALNSKRVAPLLRRVQTPIPECPGDVSTLRMLDQIETQYLLRLREDREEVKRTATEVGVMGEGDMRRRLDKETS